MSELESLEEHRASVASLFETLTPIVSFEPVGDGWTCHTYRVNDDWIVQLPRSKRAAETLRIQMDVLPELAREVSAAVPVPELISRDPAAMAYRRIDGEAAGQAPGVWPERLGRFLYDLHMVRPEFVGMRACGPDDVRLVLDRELADLRERVFPVLAPAEQGAFGDRFRTFLDDDRNWRFSSCVTHNDIVATHILVTTAGDLEGVIDWEEVAVGDPANDFAWLLGSESEAGEWTLAAYGGAPDDRFLERCAFRYMLMPWHDVVHGLDSGRSELVDAGLVRLRERAA
jgi:aminoglycoside phosphotransferase (APT) family kinase protein